MKANLGHPYNGLTFGAVKHYFNFANFYDTSLSKISLCEVRLLFVVDLEKYCLRSTITSRQT